MNLSDKLNEVRNEKGLIAKEVLSKMKTRTPGIKTKLSDVRDWFSGKSCPDSYEMILLGEVLGLEKGELEEFHLFGDKAINTLEIHANYSRSVKLNSQAKPGKKVVSSKIKNKSKIRLHDINPPKDKSCKHCNIDTGTERFCHSEATEIKMLSGGGITGGKIEDNLTAWLCSDCDIKLSTKPLKNDSEINHIIHANKWYKSILKTHLIS